MRRRFVIIISAALLAVVIVVAAVWLRGDGRPRAGSRLRVMFSGETMGELEPCNCSGKMAGGLPKRGGYLNAQKGEWLLVDVGCLGSGRRDFEVLRARATLRAMHVMHYDAVNVGEHELWLGRETLDELASIGVPFVSANVVGDDGAPVFERYLVVKRSGLDVAITGLVERGTHAPGAGLSVTPPRETLAALLPELRREAGVIVVLADLTEQAVRELAGDFPEITLIVFRGRKNSLAPERVNRTVIASIYGEARYLGDLTLAWANARRVSATGEAVLLDERFGESHKVVETCVDWYKAAVSTRTFDLSQPGPGWERIRHERPEAGNRYVGSEGCKRCHPYQYKVWKTKRHSHAMATLKKVGYDRSPECFACHVVGVGADDGYRSMETTPELGRVGCEACHGRGHILRNGNCKGKARRGNKATCMRCHTRKRHATFTYDAQWKKIDHRKEKKKP